MCLFLSSGIWKIIPTHFGLITDSILTDYPLWLIGRKRHYPEYPANIEMIGGKQ